MKNFDGVRVGDKMQIKENLEIGLGRSYHWGSTKVTRSMLKYAGDIVTVSQVLDDERINFEETSHYTWTPEMMAREVVKNLKVGDKVRVREDLELYKDYPMHNSSSENDVVSEMADLAGEIVTISMVGSQYSIEEERFRWTDGMFEKKIIEVDDELEEEDNNKMAEVAKILGIELGEKFNLLDEDGDLLAYNPHQLTEQGIIDCDSDRTYSTITKVLCGDFTIEPLKKDYSEEIADEMFNQDIGVICTSEEGQKMLEILEDSGLESRDGKFADDNSVIVMFRSNAIHPIDFCKLSCYRGGCNRTLDQTIDFDIFLDFIGYTE